MTDTKKKNQTENESEKSWTWQEISKHNKRESCWIYVNRDVYDVTKWLPQHPGGEEPMLLFSGRDCTEAFRAYHPFTDKPYAILEQYKIGTLKGPSELVRWKADSGFYKTLRERCGDYFRKNNIDPVKKDSFFYEFFRLFTSIGLHLLLPYLALVILRWYNVPFLVRMLVTFPASVCGVMIATNVGHMASHVPMFHMPRLNRFLGWVCFDACVGLSWEVWLHEHVVGHHQYTNIITIDPNAPDSHEDEALYRSSPHQKWYSRFYFQFIWLPVISCLLVLENRMAAFRLFSKGLRNNVRVNAEFINSRRFFYHVVGKIIWTIRTLYIPIIVWKVSVWETLFYFTVTELLAGYIIGTMFPANHITNKVDWPVIVMDEKTGDRRIDQEWAVMQVKTTKDYGYESWIFTHIFGSLNNHSPHHLFPALHHTHYYELYPIVKQTAKDFNIELSDVGNFYELVYDYIGHLWSMGYDPKKAL